MGKIVAIIGLTVLMATLSPSHISAVGSCNSITRISSAMAYQGLENEGNQVAGHSSIQTDEGSYGESNEGFDARRRGLDIDEGGWIALGIFLGIGAIIIAFLVLSELARKHEAEQRFRKDPRYVRDVECAQCYITPPPDSYERISRELPSVGDTTEVYLVCYQGKTPEVRACTFRRIEPIPPRQT